MRKTFLSAKRFTRYKWLGLLNASLMLVPIPLTSQQVYAGEVNGQKMSSGTANDTSSVSTENFWKLYRSHNYTGAASIFEALISSGKPDANVFYYAALANQQIYKDKRAKQLFSYVVTAFPGTSQATYAQKCLDSIAPKVDPKVATASTDAQLPASVKNALPANMQALLNTDAGKAAVSQAVKDQSANIDTISKAEKSGVLNSKNISSAAASNLSGSAIKRTRGEHPFTADQIAREGPNGIDQTNAPNCWFESAMSALAQIPKGQRMISQMICYGEGNTYLVRFPGDGVEYKVTTEELRESGVNSTALWASLLDYAERKKYPNNAGASGVNEDKHRLQTGLGAITGSSAEMIYPPQASKQDITSFIYGAVSTQSPITAGTSGRNRLIPAPIIEGHAYTIIGFDPSRSMVTIRNPHGRKARKFSMPDDPQHLKFEQLDDGVFKMNLDLFCDSFGSVCRSFL